MSVFQDKDWQIFCKLIVSVSGRRSRNTARIGAWTKVFVCLTACASENKHKAVPVMTRLVPTANDEAHTQTHTYRRTFPPRPQAG